MNPYYDQDGITIYHGDSRDLLDGLQADVVITDPPYGVDLTYGVHDDSRGDGYEEFVTEIASMIRRATPLALVTPGIRNLWLWPPASWVLCWAKPGSTRRSDLGGFNEWEPILMYGKRRLYHDLRSLPTVANLAHGETGDHPCPKPIKLLTWLVAEATDAGEMVLDPFMGSGTTLVAAKNLGRKAVGIEIEEHYCEIAARRLAQGVLAL